MMVNIVQKISQRFLFGQGRLQMKYLSMRVHIDWAVITEHARFCLGLDVLPLDMLGVELSLEGMLGCSDKLTSRNFLIFVALFVAA
jgi:hypothetical protein